MFATESLHSFKTNGINLSDITSLGADNPIASIEFIAVIRKSSNKINNYYKSIFLTQNNNYSWQKTTNRPLNTINADQFRDLS
jgi:hypothetical protein